MWVSVMLAVKRLNYGKEFTPPLKWRYRVFLRPGLTEDGVIKTAWEARKTEIPPDLNGWHFGCKFAGRGDATNKAFEIIAGEPVLLHQAPEHRSYTSLIDGAVEGDSKTFTSYIRLARLKAAFKQLGQPEIKSMLDGVINRIINAGNQNERILVTAGHYMPFLPNLELVRGDPLGALGFGVAVVAHMRAAGLRADLAILINDLHMLGGTETEGNPIRRQFWRDYTLPSAYQEIIGYGLEQTRGFEIWVTGERMLYNRIIREARNDPRIMEILQGFLTETKCIGALTRFLQFARNMGYGACIEIYPTCDMNSRRAAEVATQVYGAGMIPQTFIVLTTLGC